MVNGVIIISPDGEITEKEVTDGGKHKIPLVDYLEKHNLIYEGYQDETAHFISIYLASINYIVIKIENYRHLYYIGEKITENQEKWYKTNKRNLKKYKASIANLTEGNIEYFEEEDLNKDGIKGYNKLKEIIEEKEIIKNKVEIK